MPRMPTTALNRARSRRILQGCPQRQIADEEEEEKEGQREPGVPGPPRAPDRLGPDRSGREHHEAERHADLGGGGGESVEPGVVQPEIERAGDSHQREGEQRAPGRRHVEVEDLLRQALARLHRREPEGQHVDPGEPDQGAGDASPARAGRSARPRPQSLIRPPPRKRSAYRASRRPRHRERVT